MAIPGFSKVSSERLRKNRGNFGIILLLWGAFVVYTVIAMGPAVWLVVAAAVLRGLGRQARFGAVFLGLVYLYLGGYVCIPPLAHALDALAG